MQYFRTKYKRQNNISALSQLMIKSLIKNYNNYTFFDKFYLDFLPRKDDALKIIKGMCGFNGIVLPISLENRFGFSDKFKNFGSQIYKAI